MSADTAARGRKRCVEDEAKEIKMCRYMVFLFSASKNFLNHIYSSGTLVAVATVVAAVMEVGSVAQSVKARSNLIVLQRSRCEERWASGAVMVLLASVN